MGPLCIGESTFLGETEFRTPCKYAARFGVHCLRHAPIDYSIVTWRHHVRKLSKKVSGVKWTQHFEWNGRIHRIDKAISAEELREIYQPFDAGDLNVLAWFGIGEIEIGECSIGEWYRAQDYEIEDGLQEQRRLDSAHFQHQERTDEG